MPTATEVNHAEEQTKAQLESIVEMVAGLDEEKARQSAAEEYASKLDRARCVGLLLEVSIESYDSEGIDVLREAVVENIADETITPDDFEFDFDEEAAQQTIQEDPLSVELRSGWYTPGETPEPEQFCILLCTGGPAVRIVGDLERGSPSRPRIQYQDWGTPWTEYFPTDEQRDALQTYCEQFYYGD